jgi:hypothetical protein
MDSKTKPMFSMFLLLSGAILLIILYYYAYPLWASMGLRSGFTDSLMLTIYRGGSFSNPYAVRFVCLFFCSVAVIVRSGSSKDSPWRKILIPLLSGVALFFAAPLLGNRWVFILTTFFGYCLFFVGAVLLGRKYRSFDAHLPDYWDSFKQCEQLVSNPYSVNIPMKYQFKGKLHQGYINVVNPFRGSMVLGTPGSGKSYSIYGPFIRQMIQKGYSLFVYDYKFPDLTSRVMNELLDNYEGYGELQPKMYVVNFDDPLYSHRFNPIHPRYLKDPIDATEIAEVILKNANRENAKGEDFFSLSARCYLDLLIWFLRCYKGGRYCTFPHLIELMGQDYREVLEVLQKFDELEVKRTTFADAMQDQAYEQLQGQIASARVPLIRFSSKTLYWTLSGDDFSLEMNDPKAPSIICVGNNPKRQSVYGTTLAMLMSQLFKVVNNPGKRHCAVLIDELPTIYLKGLDNLINTARSNKVAVVIGAQDKSQLVKDYDQKESDVIFNTVGNVFAGAVKGSTAEGLSKSFGKEEQEMRSYQESDSSDHVTYSWQQREVLPPNKIEALSQGSFCGYVADNYDQKIHPKTFCGEVQAGEPPRHNEPLPQIVQMTRTQIEEEVNKNYEKIRNDIVDLIWEEINNPL